jgi:hypothetical protein
MQVGKVGKDLPGTIKGYVDNACNSSFHHMVNVSSLEQVAFLFL